jgi:hypothetical protein
MTNMTDVQAYRTDTNRPRMTMTSRFGRVAWWLALVAGIVTAGCGSSASIMRTDGQSVTGRIVRSEGDTLYLQQDEIEAARMERDSVRDIDHPGNVAMVAGGLLLGTFGLMMTSGGFRDELVHGPHGDANMGARPVTVMFAVPGFALLGTGLYHYVSSKRAARNFEHARDSASTTAVAVTRAPGNF